MKKFVLIFLTALMLLAVPSLSACGKTAGIDDKESADTDINAEAPADSQLLPDSVLYYGEVLEITAAEDGSITQIYMNSEADGKIIINVGPQTFWIDSGNMKADDPSTLKEGDRIYVFHSPIVAMSLPAQSAGFAIVRNIPADAGCAMFHEIEEVNATDKGISIVTDNGSKTINADAETVISAYDESEVSIEDVKKGGHMMVIYNENLRAAHIMLLPEI